MAKNKNCVSFNVTLKTHIPARSNSAAKLIRERLIGRLVEAKECGDRAEVIKVTVSPVGEA